MSDSVDCPYCGHRISDLWEFDWDGEDDVHETECGDCNKVVYIRRRVSIDYDISTPEKVCQCGREATHTIESTRREPATPACDKWPSCCI